MHARNAHRIGMTLEGGRAACLLLSAFVGQVAFASDLSAQSRPASAQAIAAAGQETRDQERIDILRQELKKSEEQLESLARRRAERLALSDMQAVREADEQHARLLGDIAALQRETASALRDAGRALPTKPIVAPGRHRAIAGWTEAPRPWWDVYGNDHGSKRPVMPAEAAAPEQDARVAPALPLPSAGATP